MEKEEIGQDYMNDISEIVYKVAEQLVVGQEILPEKVQYISERLSDICIKELSEYKGLGRKFKILCQVIIAQEGDCGLCSANCCRWEVHKDYMHQFNFDSVNHKVFITIWTLPL